MSIGSEQNPVYTFIKIKPSETLTKRLMKTRKVYKSEFLTFFHGQYVSNQNAIQEAECHQEITEFRKFTHGILNTFFKPL